MVERAIPSLMAIAGPVSRSRRRASIRATSVSRVQAAGTPGIVEGDAQLRDVGDAVLQLHEHVRAVVEAQAVAGAEVLVDPDPHGHGRPLRGSRS